jgi:ADP-heptose:LPS heptosyltransferase
MKMLVISLAGIGDTLFATPLIRELRTNFPKATVDALVLWRGAQDVLTGNPHLNRIYQCNLIAESKLTALKFLLKLRREHYDVSFNTYPQSRVHYRLVARIIGARTRISHRYHSPRLVDRLLVNRESPQDYSRHAIQNNLTLLEFVSAEPKHEHQSYELFLTASEYEFAEKYIRSNGLSHRKILGIHVGSGGTKNLALRRWPLANFIALIQLLGRLRPNLSIILFGGPEEEAANIQVKTQANAGHVFRPVTKNLRETAALIKRCHVFLSVDTALMHVAAAMRVPAQVVIETPTWNKPIEPYGNSFTTVTNPAVAGRNLEFYRYDGCGIRGTAAEIRRCMESVSVDSVLQTVNSALA